MMIDASGAFRIRHGLALFVGCALATLALALSLPRQAEAAQAGSLDRSFSHDGRKLTDFFGRNNKATSLSIQPDGKIVAGGSARPPKLTARPAIARYHRDGRLDSGFSGDGKRVIRRWIGGEVGGLAITEGGKIVVASYNNADLSLARFRRDGSLDRSFGHRGTVSTDIAGRPSPQEIAIQPDGKIVVAGYTHGASGGDWLIMARYRRNGMLDQSFGEGGTLITDFGQDTFVKGYGLALQDDGKMVVSGEVGNSWILARFMPDGSLDEGFGNDSGVAHSGPIPVGQARDVAIQPDGRIVAAGRDFGGPGSAFAIARYLADGSPDASFAQGGGIRIRFQRKRSPRDFASALALQPDGKMIVAGTAELPIPHHASREPRFAIARFRPGGKLDSSFSGDGRRVLSVRPNTRRKRSSDHAEALSIQRDGGIVVAGDSSAWRGDEDFAIARLHGRG